MLRQLRGPALRAFRPCSSGNAKPEIKVASEGSAVGESDLIITDRAVHRLQQVAKKGERLRVLVDSGGCSGFEYKFTLEEAGAPGEAEDTVFSRGGVSVVVDGMSLDLLRGATLDYEVELIRSAFKIVKNPLAEKGCSCGSSFALRLD